MHSENVCDQVNDFFSTAIIISASELNASQELGQILNVHGKKKNTNRYKVTKVTAQKKKKSGKKIQNENNNK